MNPVADRDDAFLPEGDMMTDQEFTVRLTHIEDQAAAMQERVDGYRDQELAKLFVESEWSQEQLAEHLGKTWGKEVSREWVSKRLLFGRFLAFFGTSCTKDQFSIPSNLTEGAFRRFWESTEPGGDFRGHRANTTAATEDEQRRFGEIVKEGKKSATWVLPKQPVRAAIVRKIAGKGAMTVEQIADRIADCLDRPPSPLEVRRCLRGFKPQPESPYRVEKWREGDTTKYRIVKCKAKVLPGKDLAKLAPELLPLVRALITEARKEKVLVSCTELCNLASKIEMLLESVVGEVSAEA